MVNGREVPFTRLRRTVKEDMPVEEGMEAVIGKN